MVGGLPVHHRRRGDGADRGGEGRHAAPRPRGAGAAVFLGFTQFCINFNAVYLAERHITSGVVATVFALLLIPSSLMGWAFLGQRPTQRFAWSSLVAVAGHCIAVRARASRACRQHRADPRRHRRHPDRHGRRVGRERRPGAAGDPAVPTVSAARLVDGGGGGDRRGLRVRGRGTAGASIRAPLTGQGCSISRLRPRC